MAEQAPTIYDVAERAGVSVATVSRALNDVESLRAVTRDKVMRAMAELDFVPNNVARGLSRGKNWVLGLAFMHSPVRANEAEVEADSLLYTDIIIRGVEAEAARHGYSLLLCSAGEEHPDGIAPLRNLTQSVDGWIVLDRVLSADEVPEISRRTPLVLMAGAGESDSAYTVRVDNEGGISSLVTHLVEVHGARRFGYMSGLNESPDNVARLRALRDSARRHGVSVDDADIISCDWTSGGAEVQTARWLDCRVDLPDVLVCANDQMAIGAIHAMGAKGLKVPRDIAVTGFDDIPIARYLTPALTTVRQSSSAMGAEAVDVLLAAMAGEPVANTTTLASRLQVRHSCGCRGDLNEDVA
jgi:LacI family transcriptional regulator